MASGKASAPGLRVTPKMASTSATCSAASGRAPGGGRAPGAAASTRFEASTDGPRVDAGDLAGAPRGDQPPAPKPQAPTDAKGGDVDALSRLRAARRRARGDDGSTPEGGA